MFTVMYHSLLIGASLFVPIPIVDDKIASFLWKRMISDLAKSHHKNLTNDQLLVLSYQSRFALSDGCVFLGRRIFREIFQEILFFLEWHKAIKLATEAYYSGFMLNELFAMRRLILQKPDSTRSPYKRSGRRSIRNLYRMSLREHFGLAKVCWRLLSNGFPVLLWVM